MRKYLWRKIAGHKYISIGSGGFIDTPIRITPEYIMLGSGVNIFKHCRIEGVSKYNERLFTPVIQLGDQVSIQQNLHMTCAESIVLGSGTAIAANVTISDIHHSYHDISISIERQNIEVSPVKIGKNCKIYNNVVILPGVTIGDHVSVGANSVVNRDIPSYTVVAGSPAKVLKKYNPITRKWN